MNAPKLRFKANNGSDFPVWHERFLEDVTDIFKSGHGITSQKISPEGEYPVYGGNGLRGYTDQYTHDGFYALIGRQGALCGNIKIADGKAYISEHAIAVRANKDSSTRWLAIKLHLMNLNRLSESSAQPGLAVNKLLKLKVKTPCKEEQEKIAQFISAFDQKISLLTKKHELLVQYKKGVMQKIFNQEIRFKDKHGKDFPEWESSTINSISTKKASTISANKIEENYGEYKIYGASGVLKTVDFYTEEFEYVSIVKDGAGAGRAFLCEPKTSVLGTMEKIIANPGVSTKFLYELLNAIDFSKFITGSTIPHVYFKDYGNSKIKLPCFEEQVKISDFLTDIDRAVDIAISKIELTKQYKQGLLQQMFV